jgi:hypothetical protein
MAPRGGRSLVRTAFDRRVVPESALAFIRACQRAAPCHLGGGAALSGAYLAHRLSNDVDLFVHDKEAHRDLVRMLPEIAKEVGCRVGLRQDSGGHVRGELEFADRSMEFDLVHEPLEDLDPPPAALDGVVFESLQDLRASKLTCLLSRSEPRDLVDVLFLERAGFKPELDLPLALRKDAGIDVGVLAWLLNAFPLAPLPIMLTPLEPAELKAYRDDLRDRFKALASVPPLP